MSRSGGSATAPSIEARSRLEGAFLHALAAVSPRRALARVLGTGAEGCGPLQIAGRGLASDQRIVALAVGKAACAMARELERWAGERLVRGLAITKDAHALPLERFAVLLAGHPIPDARSAAAAREALALAAGTRPDDLFVVLLSGGASSLTSRPGEGLSQADLAATGGWLLASGATIEELNCVRKHLGVFGGGKLAAAASAGRIELLAISDVPGDRLDVIGSGPCSGDPSSWKQALEVVERHGGREALPRDVLRVLEQGAAGERPETPPPGDPGLAGVRERVIARNADARHAASEALRQAGWRAIDAGETLLGEASELGATLVGRAREAVGSGARGVYIAGGETTVTLRGSGRGGRNQELALAAACAERGRGDWALLAVGTDGGDGSTDAAGAFADGRTVARGAELGCDAAAALGDNDSHGFFSCEGGVLRTGPTHTNVMDLALVAIDPGAEAR